MWQKEIACLGEKLFLKTGIYAEVFMALTSTRPSSREAAGLPVAWVRPWAQEKEKEA